MEDSTDINVPVDIRSHESQQLDDMLPEVAQRLTRVERDDEADTIERIYEEHVENYETRAHSNTPYISMPADDWRAVIRNLPRVKDDEGITRVWWLQKKLVDRLRGRLEELEDDE